MALSESNAAIVQARGLLDRALANPRGVRVTFEDAKYGGTDKARAEAKRLHGYLGNAKSAARKVQKTLEANAPDAPDNPHTVYDNLVIRTERQEAHEGDDIPPGETLPAAWLLFIERPQLDGLTVDDL